MEVGAALVIFLTAVTDALADAEPEADLYDGLEMPNWTEYWKVPSASLMIWRP